MAASLDVVIALVSGVPLVLLGIVLVALGPRKAEARFFGAFSILWGAQIVLANLGRLVGNAPLHAESLLASYALWLPASLFLAHVAAMQTQRRRAWIVAGFATVTAISAVVFATAPSLVVESVAASGESLFTRLGPVALPLVFAPFHVAFFVAIAAVYARYRAAGAGSSRHAARGLLIALLLYPAYNSVRNFFVYLSPPPSIQTPNAIGFATLFLAGTVLVVGIAIHLAARPPPPEERDRRLLAAIAIPCAVAIGEAAIEPVGVFVDTVGLWRIGAVGALVYAVARYQLFDLDLKLKKVVGPTLGSLIFPDVEETDDYRYRRKLDVYREALERSIADSSPAAQTRLADVRRSLGISDREHHVMEFMVRRAAPAASVTEPAPVRVESNARILDRYRVERLLGEGAHGRAYLAYDEREDRNVVLKAVGTSLFGGRAARMLAKEARIAGALHHPNIVAVHDLHEGPLETLIVMEYVDGGNLHGLLRRRGGLPWEEARRIADEILAALEAAHEKGVVHRDVKPENILLTREGHVKLADFGVARESAQQGGMTEGGAVGTLLYMSPEQVRGAAVDARSDLYAAAVILHQMLTGRFYLRIAGKDDFQVRKLILEGKPSIDVPGVPHRIASVLATALAKDPADRFASASDLRAALSAKTPVIAT